MPSAICPIAFLAALPLLAADPLSPVKTARRVAEVEARLPWFWAPPVDGLRTFPMFLRNRKLSALWTARADRHSLRLRSDRLNIRGQLSFDPETFEITAMEYEVLADIALPDRKLSKGTRFSVELERAASQYLPARLILSQKLSKGSNTREEAIQYFDFRKFTADSSVRFDDVDRNR